MHRRLHHGALELARRRVRAAVWFALIAGAYFGAAKLGMSLSVVPRRDHAGLGALRHRPRRAPRPRRALLAGRGDRRLRRQRDQRRDRSRWRRASRSGNTLAAVVGRAARPQDRLHAGARPRSLGPRPRRRRRARQHRDQRHERRHRPHARRRARGPATARPGSSGGSETPMGILVVAPILLVLYDACAATRPAAAAARARGRCAARRGRGRERDRLPRRSLALPVPDLPVPALGRPALQAGRRRGRPPSSSARSARGAPSTARSRSEGRRRPSASSSPRPSFAVVVVSLLVLGRHPRRAGGRQRGARALTASRLREAQSLAHIGSWEWDIRRDSSRWSDELYRVFGLEPGRRAADLRDVPRPRPSGRSELRRRRPSAAPLEDGQPFALEHRILRPDGHERIVLGRGRVVLRGDESGHDGRERPRTSPSNGRSRSSGRTSSPPSRTSCGRR